MLSLALSLPSLAVLGGGARWWTSAAYQLGVVAPALVADFARDRHALGGAQATASEIFTVSSGTKNVVDANGNIIQSPANMPAYTYRDGRRRLLIEGPATNSLLNSGALHLWGKLGSGVPSPTTTANAATAPDGTLTATRINYPSITGTQYSVLYTLINTLPAGNYTLSVWLRGAVGGEIVYLLRGGGVSVNVAVCALTTAWQRFVLPWGAVSDMGNNYINIGLDGRFVPELSSPAQTIYAWGGQNEPGTIATSYIPTGASAVSRIADVVQLTPAAAATLQGPAGSLAWRGRVRSAVASQPLIGLPSGYALLRGGTTPAELRLDGSSATALSLGSVLPGEIGAAAGWDGTGRAGAVNGGAALSDSNTMDRSRASIWLGGYQGLPAGCALEIDELVAWATRGTGAALTGQARGWL